MGQSEMLTLPLAIDSLPSPERPNPSQTMTHGTEAKTCFALTIVNCRCIYTKGVFRQAAADAYLRAIGEGNEEEHE
jgi:hypothetical protein